jgi:hypothetical protein
LSEEPGTYVTNPSDAEIARGEAIEAGIGLYIAGWARSSGNEAANARRELWRKSEENWRRDLEAQRNEAWRLHYKRLADLHQQLADQNRQRARELMGR